jgi:hypothetical protein
MIDIEQAALGCLLEQPRFALLPWASFRAVGVERVAPVKSRLPHRPLVSGVSPYEIIVQECSRRTPRIGHVIFRKGPSS